MERTWKNYKEEQIKEGKLGWQDYRDLVYGKPQEGQEVAPEYQRMITRDERRWKVSWLPYSYRLYSIRILLLIF